MVTIDRKKTGKVMTVDKMYKAKLSLSDLEKGDTVSLSIRPQSGEPTPAHPFLTIRKGNGQRYNVYMIPWKPAVENDIPQSANFRYGYQVVDIWDDVELIGIREGPATAAEEEELVDQRDR